MQSTLPSFVAFSFSLLAPAAVAQDLAQSGVAQKLLEAAKLQATAPATQAEMGVATAMSGDILVVGAIGPSSSPGEVHVFRRPPQGWSSVAEVAVLTASDGQPGDALGMSVGISGDTIVAVAVHAAAGANEGQGAVYLWEKPAGGWTSMTESAKLSASGGVSGQGMDSVAIDGDTVVGGSVAATVGSEDFAGSVYLWQRPTSGWASATQNAKLTASDATTFLGLGSSLAIEGDTVVAAATFILPVGDSAYLYEKPAGGWADMTETVQLTISQGADASSVAMDSDTVVIGSPRSAPLGSTFGGAAFVYEKPPSGWASATEDAMLTASDFTQLHSFGQAVAVEGDTIAVGWPITLLGPIEGAVYLYDKPPAGWTNATETTKLLASDGSISAKFGAALALDAGVLAAGAPLAEVGGLPGGAVYVFDLPTVMPNSGCGLAAVGMSGSRRIAGSLHLSFGPCAGVVPYFALGTPATSPVLLPSEVPCGDQRTCLLSCNPLAIVFGPMATVTLENDPGLVGLTLCVQGLCFEPGPCARVTDVTELVVSN